MMAASINGQLCRATDANRFATLFLALYDDGSRTLRYTNAGHNAPLLVRADGPVERLWAGGTVLGAFDSAPFEEGRTQLSEGDLLVVYSDGITEVRRGVRRSAPRRARRRAPQRDGREHPPPNLRRHRPLVGRRRTRRRPDACNFESTVWSLKSEVWSQSKSPVLDDRAFLFSDSRPQTSDSRLFYVVTMTARAPVSSVKSLV
jgi:hypothetical protein